MTNWNINFGRWLGWIADLLNKKEKFAFGLKYSVDIICTRSEIKKMNFLFLSLV